ncbi:MAG: aspartate/glutamate racemase family protein [Bacteroidales bacterium]|nr:aspartate/glutamate racemase family protein [Bacteroidales bacterium]
MRNKSLDIIAALILLTACSPKDGSKVSSQSIPIVKTALQDTASVYYADYKTYPEEISALPIGVFDSGTGGLTVLESLLKADCFNNTTGAEGSDGIPDFASEHFTYLADQANMPYGNYASAGKLDFFRELVVKDALFLTKIPNRSKIVVIACNTATAYGLNDVRDLLSKGIPAVKVIGVIEAGTRASMDMIGPEENAAIGVLATVGTISSGGYQKAIASASAERGYKGKIDIVCQPGLGFAEAVDMESDFADMKATAVRDNYRGPSIGNDSLSIDTKLLDRYKFNFAGNAVLYQKERGNYSNIQLNSAANYARLHLVNLIERHRLQNGDLPLRNIILGCTHYPFLLDTLKKVVDELRQYEKNGVRLYEKVLPEDMEFIDPSVYTAKEVYAKLREQGILSASPASDRLNAYISIPASGSDAKNLDKDGNFTYDFKYGREAGKEDQSVDIVPFSIKNINPYNLQRIRERLPQTWSLIEKEIK